MEEQILSLARSAAERAILVRRDLHKHPELALTEFRTASLVARRLADLGIEVRAGRTVMATPSAGLPSTAELETSYARAAAEGADPEFLGLFRGGYTGVVGILRGGRPGPTVALRVDMDCLPIRESADGAHGPARDGFASVHEGLMHACGHDGHTAIGLGVAEVLAAVRESVAGTVKLIFQPGEEGGKGARPMVEAGVVDDVDLLVCCHLGMDIPSGNFHPQVEGFLASTKFDATFRGQAAHAGGHPEDGKNALAAAAHAVLGLLAIARHSAGASRVNVGVLRAGSGRNIIPDEAFLMVETRGETAAVDEYMARRAGEVLEGAARLMDVTVEVTPMGATTTASCDEALVRAVAEAAAGVQGLTVADRPWDIGGSEDATFMMRRVQERGGLATYTGVGSDIPSGHHTRTFDINETDLAPGIGALALALYRIGQQPPRR